MRGILVGLALLRTCGETPATQPSTSAPVETGTRPTPQDAPDPTLAKLLRKQGSCTWLANGTFSNCDAQHELSAYVQQHMNEASFETCILSVDARNRTQRALAGSCLNQFTFASTPEERARWDTRLFKILLPRFALEPNEGLPGLPEQGVRAILASALSELSAERAGMTQAVIDAIKTMPRPDGKATELLFATLGPDSLEEKDPPDAVLDLAIVLAAHEDLGTRRAAYELLSAVKARQEVVCKLLSERVAKDDDGWSDALSSYAATAERCASERAVVLATIVARLTKASDPKRSWDDELKDLSGLRRFVRLSLVAAEVNALIEPLEAISTSKVVSEREAKDAQTIVEELRRRSVKPAR